MNNLNHSRRIRVDRIPASAKVAGHLDHLFAMYQQYRELSGKRAMSVADRESYSRQLRILILDLLSAWSADESLYVAYSRGKAEFIRDGAYWNHSLNRAILTQGVFLDLIEFLDDLDLLENHPMPPGFHGFSSRMRAAEGLGEFFRERDLNWTSVVADPDAEVVFVTEWYETGRKDDKGRPIWKKKFIPLPEPGDFDLEGARANLRRINANLQSTFINLNVPDKVLSEIRGHRTQEAEGGEYEEPREPFELSNRTLRRVFSETFSKGGRFYGGWWQGIPSRYRKFIEIDGAITREMDYSTMQPSMMYAEAGAEQPEDAYIPEGWPKEIRPFGKKAFNQLVNSDRSSRPKGQWHRFAPDLDPNPLPARWSELEDYEQAPFRLREFEKVFGRPYSDLLESLLEHHRPLNDRFFSKLWGEMQRKDSDIAERVMIRLLNEDVPITVLPIHDSFIVRRGAESNLDRAMHEAYEEVVGKPCRIKREEAVYDPPEGYQPRIIFGDMEKTLINIKNNSEYNRREVEWMRENGPIG